MKAALGFIGFTLGWHGTIRFGGPEVVISIETGYGNNYGMDY